MNLPEDMQQQIAMYRRMTGQERVKIGFELNDLARSAIRQEVRRQFPLWDDAQVEMEVGRRFQLTASPDKEAKKIMGGSSWAKTEPT